MKFGERKMLTAGVAAGAIAGLVIGLMIASYLALRPAPVAALFQ